MYFFPLASPEWKTKKEELHEVHREKEKEYLTKLEKENKL